MLRTIRLPERNNLIWVEIFTDEGVGTMVVPS